MGTQHLFPSQSKPGCSVVRSPFWLLSLPAGSVQNPFFSEAHGHGVVHEADKPWVVEESKRLEEEMTSPDPARRQDDEVATWEVCRGMRT